MRISDWSSDVCSSDLPPPRLTDIRGQDMTDQFDAIVIGSGVSGGWAAKELTEKGLKVLMLDRGVMVEHGADYDYDGRPAYEIPARDRIDRKSTRLNSSH